MTTITASSTVGLYLSSPGYTNPIVIQTGVTISTPSYAISASPAFYSWTIENFGNLSGTAVGVILEEGSVTNANTGTIAGYSGVQIGGWGTVINSGTIEGVAPPTSSDNIGPTGILLANGGDVSNTTSGYISGSYNGNGVIILNSGSLINDGTIMGLGPQSRGAGAPTVINGPSALIGAGALPVFADTLVNNGTVLLTNTTASAAVLADNVTNSSSAVIQGGESFFGLGIDDTGGGSITNAGSITGYSAIFLNSGSVTNESNGSIIGNSTGIQIEYDGGMITNAQTAFISGGKDGILFNSAGGTVINNGTIAGTSSAGFGVSLSAGGSVTNSGTIIGGSGTAVSFGGTGGNLLALDSGFSFSGLVQGSSSASNTLEMASGSSAGTMTGIGSEFLNFGSIVFDPKAQWNVSGSSAGLANGQTISGFAKGDTVALTGVTASYVGFGGGTLTLSGGVELLFQGSFDKEHFVVEQNSENTDISVACFANGTRIATDNGEMPVEKLRVGDRVPVLDGRRFATIIWIGYQRIDCRQYRNVGDIWPVRICAGAFGDGTPHRDLWLSPHHAVFVGGVLVPLHFFINGRTIVQEAVSDVSYCHIELAEHDLILAEGLPCETYVDAGNRGTFANVDTDPFHELASAANAKWPGSFCSQRFGTPAQPSSA